MREYFTTNIALQSLVSSEYYEVVTRSLGRHSEKCVEDVRIAFESLEELLATSDGPDKLKLYFK